MKIVLRKGSLIVARSLLCVAVMADLRATCLSEQFFRALVGERKGWSS